MTADLSLCMPGAFAGLADPIRQCFESVEPGVEPTFHAFVPSGVLAREILDGASADVYVSANQRYMDELHRSGHVPTPYRLAGNRLCIIVRPDRADTIRSFRDVAGRGIRLVIPQSESDPCGQYVLVLFDPAGLAETMWEKETRDELLHSFGSGGLPAFLADGRVDAGLLHRSAAQALGAEVVIVDLPSTWDLRGRITFTIGAILRDGRENPLAGVASTSCMDQRVSRCCGSTGSYRHNNWK